MSHLTGPEVARYARQISLPGFGSEAQQRLKDAKVFVVGAGGLGSPILMYLAAAGVGTITVIDPDIVDESNLHRQTIHSTPEVGQPKALSAQRAIQRLNPHVNVVAIHAELTSENGMELVSGHDIIIDGSDNFVTRYLTSDLASLSGVPCIWGAVFQFEGQAAIFWDSASSPRRTDLRDLFDAPPPPEFATSCEVGGVIGTVCLSVAGFMANEAIKWLALGLADSVGRLFLFDAFRFTWRDVPIHRAPDRTPVTGLTDYAAFCGLTSTTKGRSLNALALADRLADRKSGASEFTLVDIRESSEREIVAIPESVHIPLSNPDCLSSIADLAKTTDVILYCASGVRSLRTLRNLEEEHRILVDHLAGGMREWSGTFGSER